MSPRPAERGLALQAGALHVDAHDAGKLGNSVSIAKESKPEVLHESVESVPRAFGIVPGNDHFGSIAGPHPKATGHGGDVRVRDARRAIRAIRALGRADENVESAESHRVLDNGWSLARGLLEERPRILASGKLQLRRVAPNHQTQVAPPRPRIA